MDNSIKKAQALETLKICLNQEIKEIYVTGWTEIREKYHYFSIMDWWYYIEFENFFLCVEASQTIGTIKLHIHQNIQCNFEIEEDDIFTVKAIDNKNYSGMKVVECDLFYSNDDHELFALGIQCKDNRYLHKNNQYVFFDSLTFDGIKVGNKRNCDELLEDKRFYLEKLG